MAQIVDYSHQIQNWFTELLWPARCVGCGTLDVEICVGCLSKAKQLSAPILLPRNSYLDRLLAAALLEGIIETGIYALKYRAIQRLSVPLGDWMAGVIGLRPDTTTMFGANPLVVPVPLFPARLRERGYNQAALLARQLAVASALPFQESVLIRGRHTGSQVRTHSRAERSDNMRGAFSVERTETITDRDIVLVDDVCTTGATLEDCARALKESGARSVSAVVLARG